MSRSVPVTAACAALVTAAALVGSWQFGRADAADTVTVPPSAGAEPCLRTACPVLVSAEVNGQRVDLHATAAGDAGALEVHGDGTDSGPLGVKVTGSGARLDHDSLHCVAGQEPACLVSGESQQGTVGEVFSEQQGSWTHVERQYLSSAGNLGLRDVDDRLAVIAVQRGCTTAACSAVYAQVFATDGTDLGCTTVYASKYALPRWPQVQPAGYQLRNPCPYG